MMQSTAVLFVLVWISFCLCETSRNSKSKTQIQKALDIHRRQLPTLPVLPNGAPCSSNFQCASGCCLCPPQEWYSNGYCQIGICVNQTQRGQICGLLLDSPWDYMTPNRYLTQGGVISGGFYIESGRRRKIKAKS